jgi:hypothetical protein
VHRVHENRSGPLTEPLAPVRALRARGTPPDLGRRRGRGRLRRDPDLRRRFRLQI